METTVYLLILIVAFVGIVFWVFGRKRKAGFEKDARIPFDDGRDEGSSFALFRKCMMQWFSLVQWRRVCSAAGSACSRFWPRSSIKATDSLHHHQTGSIRSASALLFKPMRGLRRPRCLRLRTGHDRLWHCVTSNAGPHGGTLGAFSGSEKNRATSATKY